MRALAKFCLPLVANTQTILRPPKHMHTIAAIGTSHRALIVRISTIDTIATNIDRLGWVLVALQLATCKSCNDTVKQY